MPNKDGGRENYEAIAVLQRMNRHYTVADYLAKVAALRRVRPDLALATDVIVGFPGETDEDFQGTMDLLNTVRFHSSFSFRYSDRPHTRSADFADKVDEQVKQERLAAFQARQNEICLEHNQALVGRQIEILVEEIAGADGKGRTGTNHIVHFPAGSQPPAPGDLVQARILHAGMHSLKGELVR